MSYDQLRMTIKINERQPHLYITRKPQYCIYLYLPLSNKSNVSLHVHPTEQQIP